MKIFKRIKRDNRGATAIEYGLIAGAVALGITTGLYVSGKNTEATLCTVGSAVTTASTSNSACSKVGYNGNGVPSAIDPSFVPTSQGGTDGSFQGNQGLVGGLGSIVAQVLQDINAKDPIQGVYGLKYQNTNGASYNDIVSKNNDVESYSSLLSGLKDGTYTWGDNGEVDYDSDGNSVSESGATDAKYTLVTEGTNSWNNDPNVSQADYKASFDSGTATNGGTNGTGTMFQVVTSSGAVYNINGGAYLLSNGTSGSTYAGVTGNNYLTVTNANTGTVVETGSDDFNQTVSSNNVSNSSTSSVETSGFNP